MRRTASRERAIAVVVAAVILGVVALFTIGPFGSRARSARLAEGIPSIPGAQPTAPIAQPITPPVSSSAPGSPRSAADGYFDQAMRAHESGDPAQAASAGELALEAYSRLPGLDADARFHVGLLHEITRDYEAILSQADSIELFYPNHLFAYLLRQRAPSGKGDSQALNDTYRRFLDVYDQEIATNRPEYQAHARLIDSFRAEATRALGN